MKLINLISILTIAAIALSSCEGKELDINEMINNKHNPIQYVIEGQISNIVKKQHVFISKPGIISGNKDYVGVENAIVKISNGNKTWEYKLLPKNNKKLDDLYLQGSPYLANGGVYESKDYFAGKVGETYTLTVMIDGEEFTAKETMPEAEKIDNEEFEILKKTGEFTSNVYGTKKTAIWNSSNSSLFYSFITKENLKLVLTGRINFFSRNYIDDLGESTSDTQILSASGSENDWVTLRRHTPTFEYSNYIWAYTFGKGNNPLAVEQNQHPSNFNNSKISGYFSVINSREYKANKDAYQEFFVSYLPVAKTYSANYDKHGKFSLELDAHGTCKLIGMDKQLIGAYDIINNKQLRVYFTRKYTETPKDLYHFYEVSLKKALIMKPEPGDTQIFYWSRENAIFEIQSNGSIKAQDETIWK